MKVFLGSKNKSLQKNKEGPHTIAEADAHRLSVFDWNEPDSRHTHTHTCAATPTNTSRGVLSVCTTFLVVRKFVQTYLTFHT